MDTVSTRQRLTSPYNGWGLLTVGTGTFPFCFGAAFHAYTSYHWLTQASTSFEVALIYLLKSSEDR